MKIFFCLFAVLLSLAFPSYAAKSNALNIIANEPVTMMDLGIIKLNGFLGRQHHNLRGATMGASFNARKGTIDIKVSMPVKKASKTQCKKVIQKTRNIFVTKIGTRKTTNIHRFFQHEGTGYTRRINWDKVANHIMVIGTALTKKNFRDSVYCQGRLMKDKVTY